MIFVFNKLFNVHYISLDTSLPEIFKANKLLYTKILIKSIPAKNMEKSFIQGLFISAGAMGQLLPALPKPRFARPKRSAKERHKRGTYLMRNKIELTLAGAS